MSAETIVAVSILVASIGFGVGLVVYAVWPIRK